MGGIRLLKEDKEVVFVVLETPSTGCDMEKKFLLGHATVHKGCLELKDISPTYLPPGIPLVRLGQEFKIQLEDESPSIHKPIYE